MIGRSASLLAYLVLGFMVPLSMMLAGGLAISLYARSVLTSITAQAVAVDTTLRAASVVERLRDLTADLFDVEQPLDQEKIIPALEEALLDLEVLRDRDVDQDARADLAKLIASWIDQARTSAQERGWWKERTRIALEKAAALERAARADYLNLQQHSYLLVERLNGWMVISNLVSVVLCLAAAVWLSRSLTKPIYQLHEATSALDTQRAPMAPSGPREMAQLMANINAMIDSLRQREDELQRKAHALNMANQDLRQMAFLAKERGEKTRVILEAAVDGVISVNEDNVIESYNPAAEGMFGWTATEAVGKNFDLLLTEPWQTGQERFAVRKLHQKTLGCHGEVTGRRRDGSTFPIDLGVSEIRLDGRRMFIMIVQDITDRKEAEEALHRANADLERARDQALAASRAKSAFLANMSHELRTPLNAIIGYSEMLYEDAQAEKLTPMAEDLAKIFQSGKHLLTLINEILDLSKIEAGKMQLHLETFDVANLVEGVAAGVEPLILRNRNVLKINCVGDLGTMHADATKVRQILFNLLSNASKFTESGEICVSATRSQREGTDWLYFDVRDHGIGMTVDQMQRLFQDFSQADGESTRKYGGTGLGLSISRRFCRMMGGDITVESEPGRGSAFHVLLPAQVVEQAPPPPMPLPLPDLHAERKTVLVIDDDIHVQELLRRDIERSGFSVVTSSTGADGIRQARECKPCLITLDALMPGMDGWDVLATLKADPELADIPVVMISIVSDQNLGFTLGAADYLTKPIDRQQLQMVLNRYRSASPTLLIVDDDDNARDMLARHARALGCEVVEARNGREALDRLEGMEPSMILLDLMMPEMDGFAFLEELRRREREVPVVVVTAIDPSKEERLRLSGCVREILRKGSQSPAELLERVREQLDRVRESDLTPTG